MAGVTGVTAQTVPTLQTVQAATPQQAATQQLLQNTTLAATDRYNAAAAAAAAYTASDNAQSAAHYGFSPNQLAAATGAIVGAPRTEASPISSSISPLPREYQQSRTPNGQLNGIAFFCFIFFFLKRDFVFISVINVSLHGHILHMVFYFQSSNRVFLNTFY